MPASIPFSNVVRLMPLGESTSRRDESLTTLRRLAWSYFWLLIFEGVLRKWVLPGLSNPLLIVRDPIVILIYIVAAYKGIFPWNGFIAAIVALAVLCTGASFLASAMGGQGNWMITLYGVRTNFLHLPLLFLLPRIFSEADVRKVGRWFLILAFPMAVLVAAQFRAPADSRLNVGAGGEVGGQLEVAFGKIRPPGTFSYNLGLLAFTTAATAYLLNARMRKDDPDANLALAALPAVAILVAVSGSRSALVSVAIILFGVVLICLRKPVFFGKATKGLFVIGFAYFCLTFWTEFRNGLLVHGTRITTGGGIEHGLVRRSLGDLTAPFYAIADTPFFGAGLGMGTNVASGLLTGERAFLLAEGEWERVLKESGPILGFAFIALRLALLTYLFRTVLAALDRGNPLSALIFFAVGPTMLHGQFGVPTTLGFTVFLAGLAIAAARNEEATAEESPLVLPIAASARAITTVRGRSECAERLHAE